MTRILSIDPGINTGWCQMEANDISNGLCHGVVTFDKENVAQRLRSARWWLMHMFVDYKPDVVLIEKPPAIHRNAVALLVMFDDLVKTMGDCDVNLVTMAPQTWRSYIGVRKKKDEDIKDAVRRTITSKLDFHSMGEYISHDALDAIGMALGYNNKYEDMVV